MTLTLSGATRNASLDRRPNRQGAGRVATPDNLWGKRPLWAAACAAVDAVEEEDAGGSTGTWGLLPVRHLFKVFVYAYLDGILASSDIGNFVANDPALRMLCEDRALKVELLRRFRRSHRARLETMLALAMARLETVEEGIAFETARTPLYQARAKSVVAQAVFWDTMDSDS